MRIIFILGKQLISRILRRTSPTDIEINERFPILPTVKTRLSIFIFHRIAVKFTEMLPQIVRDILPPHAAEFTAVSKYVLCYEKTRYMNGFEYWYETQEREIL